jgi:GNAT superfamily N-acetyltransferase
MSDLRVREVTDASDPALNAFGDIQRAVYYDQGSLIPPEWFGRMIADTPGERRNFLIVAEVNDEKVLGGALFHYLAEPDSGFSSFLGVAREARGRGISRALHAKRFEVLNAAAGHAVPGVFIDVVNPTRLDAAELEAERRVGMDPFSRLEIFQHLGFARVDIRYEQPVGGPNGGPVRKLDLLFCPQPPASVRSVPTAYVAATMRAYWSPWLGPERAAQAARQLEERADGRAELALLPPAISRTRRLP